MSESDEHRALVRGVTAVLRTMYPNATPVVDIQRVPGDGIPPRIGDFRPDVFLHDGRVRVIAEAKTDQDLGRRHTYDQIACFLTNLEQRPHGLLVLAVTGRQADSGKTLLRFVCRETDSTRTMIALFDEFDLWLFDPDDGIWTVSDVVARRYGERARGI